MASPMPLEITIRIFHVMGQNRDFGTLFNCLTTNSKLSYHAMVTLYKIHDSLPGMTGIAYGDYEKRELHLEKLMILWRSIILSTTNKTFYPYCQYITTLDVGALESFINLLFKRHRQTLLPQFFEGDLTRFCSPHKGGENHPIKFSFDPKTAVKRILEALLWKPLEPFPHGSDSEEKINLQSTGQSSNSRSLRRIRLEYGDLLSDTSIQRSLKANCPVLESLYIRGLANAKQDKDEKLARILGGPASGSLKTFEFHQKYTIKDQSLLSLKTQSSSIVHLSLVIHHDFFFHLYLLGTCPNLATLELRHSGRLDGPNVPLALDKAKDWLNSCKTLRKLEVFNRYGPQFVTGVLIDENIPIQSLKVTPDLRGCSKTFYEALSTKSSIRELRIRFLEYVDEGSDDPYRRDDSLWESILSMHWLKLLHISARGLADDSIGDIAKRLNQLQYLKVDTNGFTNATLDSLSSMPTLRSFIQKGSSSFTFKGILSFINNLGPGNRGLHLEINSPNRVFTEEEMASARSLLNSKVGGTIEVFYNHWYMVGIPQIPE